MKSAECMLHLCSAKKTTKLLCGWHGAHWNNDVSISGRSRCDSAYCFQNDDDTPGNINSYRDTGIPRWECVYNCYFTVAFYGIAHVIPVECKHDEHVE